MNRPIWAFAAGEAHQELLQMLLRTVSGVAIALLFAGAAMAQTHRPPPTQPQAPIELVKHDGHHDNGRHLGWYKHRRGDDGDEDERRGARRAPTMPPWARPTPNPYGMPGYGSSYPPPVYPNGYPPPYLRGY